MFIKLFSLCFLLAINFATQATQASTNYEKALASYQEENYADAVIHLKNVFKEEPNYLPAHIMYAEMLLDFYNGAAAEIALNKAKDLGGDLNIIHPLLAESLLLQQKFDQALLLTMPGQRPKSIEAKLAYLRGQAYLGLKKFVPAEESFDYALKLFPNDNYSLLGKAQVFMAHKLYKKAEPYAEKALQGYRVPKNAWIVRAKLYQQNNDNQQALNTLNAALAHDADNLSARFAKAEILLAQSEYDLAEAELNIVIDKAPREPQVNFLRAVLSAKIGQPLQAQASSNTVIDILQSLPEQMMRDSPRYLYIGAYLKFQQGNYEEARSYLTQYLAIAPNFRASLMLASIELSLKEYPQAHYLLKRINREYPDNIDVLILLGRASMLVGNHVEAQRHLLSALKLNPNSAEALVQYAQSYINQFKYHQALDVLAKVEQAYPTHPNLLLMKNKCYLALSKYEQALTTTEQLIEANGDNIAFLLLHSENLITVEKFNQAKQVLKKILTKQPSALGPKILLTNILLSETSSELALNELQKLNDEYKNSKDVMVAIANVYQQSQDYDAVVFWLEKAHAIASKDPDILFELDKAYRKLGQMDKMQTKLESSIAGSPIAEEHQLLAGIYLANRNYNAAIEQYNRYIELSADRGRAFVLLANAQSMASQYNIAISSLRKALAWNDDLINANIALVKLLLKTKQIKAAQIQIDIIKTKSAGLAVSDLLQGDLHYNQGNYSLAVTSYVKAHQLSPSDQSTLSLYRSYKKLNQLPLAEQALEARLHSNKHKDLKVVLALADIYNQQQAYVKAIKLYKDQLATFPDSAVLLNNLANTLLDNNSYDEALIYANKAYQLLPNNLQVLDTLAWTNLKLEQPEEALALLRKAQAIEFNNNMIKYHLALALKMLGRDKAAQNTLIEAIESVDFFEHREEAKQLLNEWMRQA
ncbi:XrtA/PEP-CTERM system TPR-repeat protein PrsT [Thalassotalea sp. PLHSN55]|uniref:XrtA/PEP-CTERM system TPR-repeat protein PrsT n=1 Tax=Thalassotalea sp. PLHSN55 TaxID=3435888 RepID=UPI003F82D566